MNTIYLNAISFLIISIHASSAQSVSTAMGARTVGLGYNNETLTDEWSLFNNVGGLSKIKKLSSAFSAETHPSVQGANRVALALSIPIARGTAGLGLFRFGDDLYNEQVISTGYSNQMGITSLGLKLNYIQYHAEGFGNHTGFSLSFGGVADLTPFLTVGACITNINQPTISKPDHEKLPTQLNAGISFKASSQFVFLTGIQKDLDYNATFKAGIEYQIHSKFLLRTGFNLHPDAAFFGFGFKSEKIKIDYALQHNAALSFGNQISFIYAARPRKPQKHG